MGGGPDGGASMPCRGVGPPPAPPRQHLGDVGLPAPRLALEKQRPPELEGEIDRRRQAAIGDVVAGTEQFERGADGGGEGRGRVSALIHVSLYGVFGHDSPLPLRERKGPLPQQPEGEGERAALRRFGSSV